MERKHFLKTILGASLFTSIDGFASIAHIISDMNKEQQTSEKFASFGAIHLNITNLEKSTRFWTEIVGMKLRSTSGNTAELGSDVNTLVVLHETAKKKFQKGYSGLYHVAIHAPNIQEFASMVYRLALNKYPFSPVDHTMSKSVYLDDPDGINIEFTLETPERFKRVVTDRGLSIEDVNGNIRSASDRLDLDAVMSHLGSPNIDKVISNETYIGHLHLYANNVAKSNSFYQKMGFESFNNLPQFMYADVGAGGSYKHRIAMNSWHGMNKPLAPSDSAGMRHFNIIFNNKEKFNMALNNLTGVETKDDGNWFLDPTGNKICLSYS